MKNILPPLITLLIGIVFFSYWTLGFQSFTVFSYTLNHAGSLPRVFPDIQLINQDSVLFRIRDKRKYILLNFVYLNCPNVCHKVNNRLEEIYHDINPKIIPEQLELITLSFDTQGDDVHKIRSYRNHFGSDISGWTFALPYQPQLEEFEKYLQNVGVWAKTAPNSTLINHSIYLFLISPDNKIIKVFDPAREENVNIVKGILACLNP